MVHSGRIPDRLWAVTAIRGRVSTESRVVRVTIWAATAVSCSKRWASIPVAIGSGDDAQTLQDILDGIMPGMLGMIAFWLYYWLLSKKINPMVLIVATMVVGIIGAFFGVLA